MTNATATEYTLEDALADLSEAGEIAWTTEGPATEYTLEDALADLSEAGEIAWTTEGPREIPSPNLERSNP